MIAFTPRRSHASRFASGLAAVSIPQAISVVNSIFEATTPPSYLAITVCLYMYHLYMLWLSHLQPILDIVFRSKGLVPL
ncbi:exported hypothetical protein [Vibrio nigripulchritudo SOn1]|uniref:Uncharacterized protein n=1 Tax=Vibrio nigripulchritudo SOn1 TaxID=1238450 RepID=A0AAV2VHS9_9VIBR|nr:exported hypothetical protein [Vibrio nigripulchritudo SOn1]